MFMIDCNSNRFDFFVNGGGSVIMLFSREPFLDETATVYVAWNKFVNIPTVIMRFLSLFC